MGIPRGLQVMVFRRVVFETRRRPKGLLRPKTKANLKDSINVSFFRTGLFVYRIYSINRRSRISASLESRNINKRRPRIIAAPLMRRLFEYFTQKAS